MPPNTTDIQALIAQLTAERDTYKAEAESYRADYGEGTWLEVCEERDGLRAEVERLRDDHGGDSYADGHSNRSQDARIRAHASLNTIAATIDERGPMRADWEWARRCVDLAKADVRTFAAEVERLTVRVKELVCTRHLLAGHCGDDCAVCKAERLEVEAEFLRAEITEAWEKQETPRSVEQVLSPPETTSDTAAD